MRKAFITLFLLTFTASLLSARTVRTIFVQPPAGLPKTAFLHVNGSSTEVKLPNRNLSPEVDLPNGDIVITILSKPLAEGEEIPKKAQRIRIPEAWKRCLFIFVPSPKRKIFPAKVIAINASTAKFAMGNTMVYNLSTSVFYGKFGKKLLVVKPSKSGVVKPPIQKAGPYPVAIDCVLPETKKRSTICRTNWMHYPNARQILFVTPSPGQKVPRVWGVLDRRREKKEE